MTANAELFGIYDKLEGLRFQRLIHSVGATHTIFQQQFQRRRAIFTNPLNVNVRGTADDNSWYSPSEKVLTFGTGAIDDA